VTGGLPIRGLPRGRVPAFALRFLMLAACVLVVVWSVHSIGPRRILDVALAADPAWLALSLAAIGARYVIWALKWWRMMRRAGEIGFGTTLRAVLAGTFVNLVTPSANLAGGVLRAVIVQRRTGWRMALAYGWSLADQVTNFLGSLALGGLLAVAIALEMPTPSGRRAVLLAGTAAVLLTALFLLLRDQLSKGILRPGVARALARITPAKFRQDGPDGASAEWLEPMTAPLLRTGSAWGGAAGDIALGAASRFALCMANALVFRALGVGAPLFEVAAVLLLATFVGTMTGAVGGIGATEVALIGLYAKLGIPAEAAAAATLLHRGTFYGISFLGGSVAMVAGSRRRDYDEPTLRREPPPAMSPPP
jgi:uncharacterized membrane protein YbhN (UPF0104 family)